MLCPQGACAPAAGLSAAAASACAALCACPAPCVASGTACVCSACGSAAGPGNAGRHLSQFGSGDGAAAATLSVIQSVSATVADLTRRVNSLIAPPASAGIPQPTGLGPAASPAEAASAVAAALAAQRSALAAALAAALQAANATQVSGVAAIQQALAAGLISDDTAAALTQQAAVLSGQVRPRRQQTFFRYRQPLLRAAAIDAQPANMV